MWFPSSSNTVCEAAPLSAPFITCIRNGGREGSDLVPSILPKLQLSGTVPRRPARAAKDRCLALRACTRGYPIDNKDNGRISVSDFLRVPDSDKEIQRNAQDGCRSRFKAAAGKVGGGGHWGRAFQSHEPSDDTIKQFQPRFQLETVTTAYRDAGSTEGTPTTYEIDGSMGMVLHMPVITDCLADIDDSCFQVYEGVQLRI
ncbi:hypothetical protein GGX14DRAFT_387248 [Mycena pura]|uniref:Uncharacterized protein n=1 Tax=Mycena pura TaxID=153505 RepID=A0AAD6YNG2_9AGAR|nr:hypothetical protein GGX14DRAFT_387248 [Mycena pura]